MRTLGVILLAVVIGQLAVGGRALAAQAAQPAQPTPPVDPYTVPPPTWGAPVPAYAPPVVSPAQSLMMYEAQRKSGGLAIVLEIFIPGLGSLYGDHALGSLLTWGLMLAGISMLVYGVAQSIESTDSRGMTTSRNQGAGTFGVTAGVALLLGGRIYGLVDSYLSTEDYNKRLRQRMGLPVAVNFGLGRIGSGPAMSFGPRVTFTF